MRIALLLLSLAPCGVLACARPGEHETNTDASPSDAAAAADGGALDEDAGVSSTDAAAPPRDAATDGEAPHDGGAASDAGPPPSAAFVALYAAVIVPHCGGPLCHGPGTNESVYYGFRPVLQMPDPATARAVLVDQRVECMWSGDDRIRVVPFDPDASAILHAAGDGLCGRRHNVVVPELGADDLEEIERWIAAGAQ